MIYKTVPCQILRRATLALRYTKRNITSRGTLKYNNFETELLTTRKSYLSCFARSINSDVNQKGKKLVGVWLLGCSGMVLGAVVLGYLFLVYAICYIIKIALEKTKSGGGVTRLTESGLSMVTWKLLGEQRPRTHHEWETEFEKYKQFPEFKLKNTSMNIEEFKFIYFMEYAHRMWGRTIGAFYAIPAIYFWSKGHFSKAMKPRILIFGALIGIQGLMGWYMVQSGLQDRFHEPSDVPRVSQYRLASHLTFAFVLYSLFLWSSFSHLVPLDKNFTISKRAINFRKFAHVTKGMIFLTAISGAFVAGLDAGLVYNSFPKMADRWIPSDILEFSPVIRNFTENPTTVQFDHRILGTTTLALISGLWMLSRRTVLPKRARWAINSLAIMGWTQVTLGITTLLTYVPVSIAAAHQSGSLVLLSFALWLTHELKVMKYIPK